MHALTATHKLHTSIFLPNQQQQQHLCVQTISLTPFQQVRSCPAVNNTISSYQSAVAQQARSTALACSQHTQPTPSPVRSTVLARLGLLSSSSSSRLNQRSSAAVSALAHITPSAAGMSSTAGSSPTGAADNQQEGHPISSSSSSMAANSSSKTGTVKQSSSSIGAVVNKEPISSSMSPQLYRYLLDHTREPAILAELRKETATMHGGHMQIAPEQGQLLALLVELLGVRSAIEVGVFTGYSSLAVALALPADGRLVAFDRDAKTMAVAQRYWQESGVADKIDGRLGPAIEGLQELLQQQGKNSFDMAFIDADKRGYQAYFELCLKLVRPGGLIAVDNVLFYGKVADPDAQDKATLALKRFNDDLKADERVSISIVPIGDGMALCRKR